MKSYTISIEDSMFLFGYKKGSSRYSKYVDIETEAENAWYDGKNADANPYKEFTEEWRTWKNKWKECNLNG